ncbi:hypothetical protein IKU74_05860, partial [bacterium]|nr:hypothetical protein [bacterium]
TLTLTLTLNTTLRFGIQARKARSSLAPFASHKGAREICHSDERMRRRINNYVILKHVVLKNLITKEILHYVQDDRCAFRMAVRKYRMIDVSYKIYSVCDI